MARIDVLQSSFVPPTAVDPALLTAEIDVTRTLYTVLAERAEGDLTYLFEAVEGQQFTGNTTVGFAGDIASLEVSDAAGTLLYRVTDLGIDIGDVLGADPADPFSVDRLIFGGEDVIALAGLAVSDAADPADGLILDERMLALAGIDDDMDGIVTPDRVEGTAGGLESLLLGTASDDPAEDYLTLAGDSAEDLTLVRRGEATAFSQLLDLDFIDFDSAEAFTTAGFVSRAPLAAADAIPDLIVAGAESGDLHASILANDLSFVFDADNLAQGAVDIAAVTQPARGAVLFDAAADTLSFVATLEDFADLGLGETTTETFTYTLSDGINTAAPATVTVTIEGVGGNAAPVIDEPASDLAGAVSERAEDDPDADLPVSDSGTIIFSDADPDDTHFAAVTSEPAGFEGALTLAAPITTGTAGSVAWTFEELGPASDFLGEGETLDLPFEVTISDQGDLSDSTVVTVTFTGANDTPEARDGSVLVGAVPRDEDPLLTATGTIAFFDADLSDIHTATFEPISEEPDGFLGVFAPGTPAPTDDAADAAGNRETEWTFTVTADEIAGLEEVLTQDYEVTIDDGNGGTLSETVMITLMPLEMDPVISIADVTVAEDAGTAVFTITRTGASDDDIVLDLATADGSAIGGSVGDEEEFDYGALAAPVTIPASALVIDTVEVAIDIVDDTLPELAETFTLTATLAADSPGAIANDGPVTATGTILENDSVLVGATGTFLRTASDDLPAAPLVLDLAELGFAPGDTIGLSSIGDFATAPADDEAPADLLGVFSSDDIVLEDTGLLARVPGAIDAGTDFITGDVPIFGDPSPTDIPEDFLIPAPEAEISGEIEIPEGAAFLMVATIDTFYADNVDAEPDLGVGVEPINVVPRITVSDVDLFEPGAVGGTAPATFEISRFGVSEEDITLRVFTRDGFDDPDLSAVGTAGPGLIADFVPVEEADMVEIVIPGSTAPEATITFDVLVNQDAESIFDGTADEDPETFELVVVQIDGDGMDVGDPVAGTGTIRNLPPIGEPDDLLVTTDLDVVAADGVTSLREAVARLNAGTADGDTIEFAPALAGATITLDAGLGQLELDVDGTIDGSAAAGLTISGGGASRVLATTDETVDLTISDLTISDGFTTAAGVDLPGGAGAGIYASGSLTLERVTVSDNRTEGEDAMGGGVFVVGAATVLDSVITGNTTTGMVGKGGGIAVEGAFRMERSAVTDNTTTGEDGEGGGICADGDTVLIDVTVTGNTTTGDSADGGGIAVGETGSIEIEGGTVALNTALGEGGGIFSRASVTVTGTAITSNSATGIDAHGGGIAGPEVTVTDSVIAGNTATGDGGAIDAVDVIVTNAAIEANSAGNNGGAIWNSGTGRLSNVSLVANLSSVEGGALFSEADSGSVLLENVTITGNSQGAGFVIDGTDTMSFDLQSSIVMGNADDEILLSNVALTGDNIIGDELLRFEDVLDEAIMIEDVFAVVVGGAGVLADNGGGVETVALAASVTNPALDATILPPVPSTDARGAGFARDVDFVGLNDDLGGVQVDLGAFELQVSEFPDTFGEMEFLVDPIGDRNFEDGVLDDWEGFVGFTASVIGVGDVMLDIVPVDSNLDLAFHAFEIAPLIEAAFDSIGITVETAIDDRQLADGANGFEFAPMPFGDLGDSLELTFPDGQVTAIVPEIDPEFLEPSYGVIKLGAALDGDAGSDDVIDGFSSGGLVEANGGFDTVVYDLSRDDITEALLPGGDVLVTGPDGAFERLSDVEKIALTDGAYLYDLSPEAAEVHRLFAAAFGRESDEAGLRFWDAARGAGQSAIDQAGAFVASAEFEARFGGAAPETEAFVDALFLNVFGRAADADGQAFWAGAFEGGTSRAEMLLAFAESPENLAATADDTDDGIWVTI